MYRTIARAAFLPLFLLASCSSLLPALPTVQDKPLKSFVRSMALEIVAVSEHRNLARDYRFELADFARRDILGLSLGGQRIFISYELSRLALTSPHHRWLLRHTLAHEIAHDVLGGEIAPPAEAPEIGSGLANRITAADLGLPPRVRFRPYSRRAELAADRKGMEYWEKLGWDCGQWVRLFTGFMARGYVGDTDHPTKERLDQAIDICARRQAAMGTTMAR